MKHFEKEAALVLEKACNGDQDWLEAHPPIFSYDNTNLHDAADEVVGPIGSPNRAPLPPYSPDMHKVIEHSYNFLTMKLNQGILHEIAEQHAEKPFPPDYWPRLVEEVYRQYTTESIRKDVRSLMDTYRDIVAHGGARCRYPYN